MRRAREVLMQFLVEAMALASFGGLLGILLALATSLASALILQVPFVLEGGIIAIASLFSAAVGIVFGFSPARRAARLDPIEAFRGVAPRVEHRGLLLAVRDSATSQRCQGDGGPAALDNSRVLSTHAEVARPQLSTPFQNG
jgi:predicted lysophospholipase L1 biosynthesis ABC-type transport system permease subunit